MTRIVAITGKRGSGKDTAAQGLFDLGYKRMSFADPLREVVQIVYGVTMEEMTDPVIKEKTLERYPFKSPREILTRIGTEGFRNFVDDTWVQALIRKSSAESRVVVPDLRFLNEEKELKASNALIIRIVNPNRQDTDAVSQHRSETEMDQIEPDVTIQNDGTIQDLHNKIRQAVKSWEFYIGLKP